MTAKIERIVALRIKREQRAERVKALRAAGWTQEKIGVELGVTQGTVGLILRANGLGGRLIKPREG